MSRINFAITITILSLALGLVIFSTAGFGVTFIRFHLSDVIIVMFLYGLWSFTKLDPLKKALGTICVALAVEVFQYFYHPEAQTALEELVIGSTFDLKDIVMYVMGALTALLLDRRLVNQQEYETKN